MTHKRQLDALDAIPSPDLWDEIRSRPARVDVDPHGPMADLRPVDQRALPWAKVGTIAAASAIGLVAVILVVGALRPRQGGSAAVPRESGVLFPTAHIGPDIMAAGFEGSLIRRGECLLIEDTSYLVLPVWPEGYTLDRNESGVLELLDGDGSIVGALDLPLAVGGGFIAEFQPQGKVEPRADQIQKAEELIDSPLPRQCLTDEVYGVWLVSSAG